MGRFLIRLIALCATAFAAVQQPTSATQPSQPMRVPLLLSPVEMKWTPGPAALPPGAQMTVLEGDLAKPGALTLRIRMPDGFRVPPHWHAVEEHVTIIQGAFVIGLGQEADQGAMRALTAGSFATLPARTRHFARAQGDTVIQIHGAAPWVVTYGDPDEDPRRNQQVIPIR